MEAGIRELRADLSRFLKRVREGEEIVVTDRGKPVAKLVLARESTLDRLIAAGLVTRARRPWRAPLPKRVKADGTVSDLVTEQRR